MISKTQLKQRIHRKTNPALVETLSLMKKHTGWNKVAQRLSGATRLIPGLNLNEIDSRMKEGDTVVITGKVLGVGTLTKKGKICALSFSASALAKLQKAKCATATLAQEIKANPNAQGVVILP